MDSLCETYISIKDPSNYSKKCIVCLIDNVVVGNIITSGIVNDCMLRTFFPKWETFTEILKSDNHKFIFNEKPVGLGTLWDGENFIEKIQKIEEFKINTINFKKIKDSCIFYEELIEPVKDYTNYIIDILEEYLNIKNVNLNIILNFIEDLDLNENKTIKIGINTDKTIVLDENNPIESKLYFNEKNYTIQLDGFYNEMDLMIDYSKPNIKNIELYDKYNFNSYYIAPIIYKSVSTSSIKTIDLLTLFFENVNPRRKKIINDFEFVTSKNNCFGEDLKQLLMDTKILINVHSSDYKNTFEELRCLPALMCKCLVISEISPFNEAIPYNNLVVWVTYDNLVSKTKEVLNNYDFYFNKIFTPENISLLNSLHLQNVMTIDKIIT